MNQRLTDAIVREILAELAKRSGPSLKEVASNHQVTVSTVSGILRNKTWKHIPRLGSDTAPRVQH